MTVTVSFLTVSFLARTVSSLATLTLCPDPLLTPRPTLTSPNAHRGVGSVGDAVYIRATTVPP